jgi:hypothetical protein
MDFGILEAPLAHLRRVTNRKLYKYQFKLSMTKQGKIIRYEINGADV